MAESELLNRIIDFVRSIGVRIDERPMFRPTLVPGIDIVNGGLIVEEARLCKPADVLHEAAHIALTPPSDRPSLDGTISSSPTEEIAAIGWTWAAAQHLAVEPDQVFHDEVISGNGPWLREMFVEGRYLGVPMLQYWGLVERDAYPHMTAWVRR